MPRKYKADLSGFRFFKWWDRFNKSWESVIPVSQATEWVYKMRSDGYRVEERKSRR